ncbi:MAG: FAD:protein FMN transferase [Pseudomonadota bacterium]
MQKTQLRAIWALLLSLIVVSCAPSPSTHELSGEAWGTTYRIKIVAQDKTFDEDAVAQAVRETLTRLDDEVSNWNPDSEVSRFNALESTDPVALSLGFNLVMSVAGEVHRQSDGFLDLTLAPVIELWNFGSGGPQREGQPIAPSDAAIEEAMGRIGQESVIAHDAEARTLAKIDPEATVFLSALAKGAGIDTLSEALSNLGHANYMIEVGGDLIAVGAGPSGKGWRIAIEQPTAGRREAGEVVALQGLAMATSGDYRNYFEEDGVRYSHILDPQTGRPITHRTASVTVLAETAVEADAWATALLAAGEGRGMVIAEREGIAALFIARAGSTSDPEFESAASSSFETLRSQQGI